MSPLPCLERRKAPTAGLRVDISCIWQPAVLIAVLHHLWLRHQGKPETNDLALTQAPVGDARAAWWNAKGRAEAESERRRQLRLAGLRNIFTTEPPSKTVATQTNPADVANPGPQLEHRRQRRQDQQPPAGCRRCAGQILQQLLRCQTLLTTRSKSCLRIYWQRLQVSLR